MDYYIFPSSNLITKFQEEHYGDMNYDQKKMSTSHNWYEYSDMTNYINLTQLLDEVRTFITSPEFCVYFGPGDIKRIDSAEILFQEYRQFHRKTDGRLAWKRLSIIDKKILRVEKKLGLGKGNEDKGCQTMGDVVSIPKQYLLDNLEQTTQMFDKLEQNLLAESYQPKLVVFIDIQNFSEIVSNRKLAVHILAMMYAMKGVLEQNPGVQVTVMSDSIVITQPYEGACYSLLSLFMSLNNFCFALLSAERVTFARGFVSVGEVYHKDEVVYGEGIVKAVRGEKEKKLFGIWLSEPIAFDIDEACKNLEPREKTQWDMHLYKTELGTRLDYLSTNFMSMRYLTQADDQYFGQTALNEFNRIRRKLFIEISEIKSKGKDIPKLKGKFCDFAHYFNQSLMKLWTQYSQIYDNREIQQIQEAEIDEKALASEFSRTD